MPLLQVVSGQHPQQLPQQPQADLLPLVHLALEEILIVYYVKVSLI